MKTFFVAVVGSVMLSGAILTAATPAFALGRCGPNRHRNFYGYCAFGGQNQAWCSRHTGHYATRMPNGTLRCFG